MIKNIVVFGLGWQGKQFVRFFKNNNYNIIGVCKTQETKIKVTNEFGINVFIDYKKCLNNNIDLLVLCAYPIDIYDEIIQYSKNYEYKILSDLPITFDLNKLNNYISNDKLFLFLLETKTEFFNNYYKKNLEKIKKVNCLVLQNKGNLRQQKYLRESVIVDTHYMFNNLLGVDNKKLDIRYKFVDRDIKNVEYIIELLLDDLGKIIYKYEDGRGIIVLIDKEGNTKKKTDYIVFDLILREYLKDIENNYNKINGDYLKNFTYLLNNLLGKKQIM
ncbi:MAG: hypothetical protein PHN31_02660 [Candidatus Gracilibacteria bacterium]|nr:hypothetical protein [Candidatus Gracilibacteria bacterium]